MRDKPGMMIMVGLGKPKGSPSQPPPGPVGRPAKAVPPKPKLGKAPAPDAPQEPDADDMNRPEGGGSVSPEEVNYKSDDLCQDCVHFDGSNCNRYGFEASPNGHCAAGFEPKGGGMDAGADMAGGHGEPEGMY